MPLFGSTQSYLGIDIGSSSVKIVELKNDKGRPRLVTYGFIEQPNNIVKIDSKENREKIIKSIKSIVSKAKTTSAKAIAALPSYTVFSSIIHLPQMAEKEMVQAVKWEAKKFVPLPLEEMILDWKLIKEEGKKEITSPKKPEEQKEPEQAVSAVKTKVEKTNKILLTAAPKLLVERYIDIFKQAGLQLVSLETEAFALERSLIGNDKSPVIVVDIGAVATNISVIVGSIPLINRSIDVGGNSITKAIANSLNIDLRRAEQFKRDFGMSQSGQEPNSEIPNKIEFIISSVVNEIKYVINLYQNQSEQAIEKMILSGGSAFLPNLPQYLSQVLNLKVFIGDPWARVVYPVELKPVLAEIGPRFAVAIGLAMREIV